MKYIFLFAKLVLFTTAHAAVPAPTPDQALQMLVQGNDNFVKGKVNHLSYLAEAKDKLIDQQSPFAVIVGCSDSRVPPELIFDRGLGELFVVRDAGNVIGAIEMDSVEFAVAALKVPLVIVLGHQNCGAVKAALEGVSKYPELETIVPLINDSLKNCEAIGTNRLINAIHCNVNKGVATLKNSPTIAPLIQQKKVKIIGAYYEIATGKVDLISGM
jgi:carbonic anhydrase